MKIYKVSLSEQEVKGIGISRWAAIHGRKYTFISFGSLLWLVGMMIVVLASHGQGYLKFFGGIIAFAPMFLAVRAFMKVKDRAAAAFLEVVRQENSGVGGTPELADNKDSDADAE